VKQQKNSVVYFLNGVKKVGCIRKPKHLWRIVKIIFKDEISRVEKDPTEWFGKVVIFNKLVAGTAPHLREQLIKAIEPLP